jgi:pimeloyl-ACP methyl ester carboxylesterase
LIRLSARSTGPLRLDASTGATCAPLAAHVEVNGICLPYVEQGSGQPVVFVHGAISDLRVWEPVRAALAQQDRIATTYRFIAYTQRYFGINPWPDDGRQFTAAIHADDLTKFIEALDAGPVHLVGTSYGGLVAAIAAVSNPALVRSLVLYEPALVCLLPEDSEHGKAARQDRAEFIGPVISALRAGDAITAARLMYEAVNQLPRGGFDREPQAIQATVLDNARTLPLLLATLSSSEISCAVLNRFDRPTLIMRGEKTQPYYVLINQAISRYFPAAQQVILKNVNHGGPRRDPTAFTGAVFDFLSKRDAW